MIHTIMRCWKCSRRSWHEHGVNGIDGVVDRLLRARRSGAGSVLQAGRESYRFAQGHDEADDLPGRGIELVAWTLVLEHVPLSLHPKKLRAVYKAEQFLS